MSGGDPMDDDFAGSREHYDRSYSQRAFGSLNEAGGGSC